LIRIGSSGSDGLRDVRLEASQYIRTKEDSLLRCNYDLESETLYAVKWYRGKEEFYRFIKQESRPKQVFPVFGISVDVSLRKSYKKIQKSFDQNLLKNN